MERALAITAITALALAPLAAQVPHDQLIYVHQTPSATTAALGILDPTTGVTTPLLPSSGALTTSGSRTVAIDPQAPATIYTSQALSISISPTIAVLSLDGNLFTRSTLTLTGVAALPNKLRWAPGRGLLALARNRMFVRDMTTGTVTAQPSASLLPASATDMTFSNGRAYASSAGSAANPIGTIVEWDLAANTDRIVGASYPPITAIAAFAGTLLVGDAGGNLATVDPATGLSTPFLSLGAGRILSIAVDSASRAFVLVENGGTWSIHDAFAPAVPLWSTTTALEDLVCAPTPVATMLTFGAGCPGSNARNLSMAWSSLPALGSTLTLQCDGALPNAPSFLVFGSSRTADALGSLPRDLGSIGMPGCTQYVDALATSFVPTTGAGGATVPLPVPAVPALGGLRVPMQWLALDAAANAFGAAVSNGVEAWLR